MSIDFRWLDKFIKRFTNLHADCQRAGCVPMCWSDVWLGWTIPTQSEKQMSRWVMRATTSTHDGLFENLPDRNSWLMSSRFVSCYSLNFRASIVNLSCAIFLTVFVLRVGWRKLVTHGVGPGPHYRSLESQIPQRYLKIKRRSLRVSEDGPSQSQNRFVIGTHSFDNLMKLAMVIAKRPLFVGHPVSFEFQII